MIEYDGKVAKVISVDVLKKKYRLQFNDKSILEVDSNDRKK